MKGDSIMKITEINTQNFKKGTCTQPLTGLDLFIGPNGSGKTSRAESIIFSMLGYIPTTDKKLGEIYSLASNTIQNIISTGIKVSNGINSTFEIERSVTKKVTHKRNGDEEFKYEEGINLYPPKGEKKLDDKKMRITSEIGNFPLMFDFNEFKRKSDMEKREFIYSLTPNSTNWNKSRILMYLKGKLLTPSLKSKSMDLYSEMENILKDALNQYSDVTVEQGIDSLCLWVKNQNSYWTQEQTRCESSVKELSEIKNLTPPIEGNLNNNQNQLQKLEKHFIEVEKKLAVKLEQNKNSSNRLKELTSSIKKVETEINSIDQFLIRSISKESIQKQILALKESTKSVDDNSIKTLREEIQKINLIIQTKNKNVHRIIEDGLKKKSYIENFQKSIDIINKHSKCCVLNNKIKCDKDFTAYVNSLTKTIATATMEKDKLSTAYSEMCKEINGLKENLARKENLLTRTIDDDRNIQKNNLAISTKINSLNNLLNQIDVNTEKLQLKRNELSSLKEKLSSIPKAESNDDDMLLLKKQRDGLNTNIAALKEKIRIQEKETINTQNLNKAIIDNKIAKNKEVCFNMLNEKLGPKGLKGEIMKSNLNPIQNLIQENLNILGVKNTTFFFECESEKGKEIFKMGWIDKLEHKVTFNNLSEGEKIILMIAFLVAVIEKSNPKLKVLIIDNIVNIDAFNLKNIIKGLNKMNSKLDNIIVLGCLEPKVAASIAKNTDFKIWDLDNSKNQDNIQVPTEDVI